MEALDGPPVALACEELGKLAVPDSAQAEVAEKLDESHKTNGLSESAAVVCAAETETEVSSVAGGETASAAPESAATLEELTEQLVRELEPVESAAEPTPDAAPGAAPDAVSDATPDAAPEPTSSTDIAPAEVLTPQDVIIEEPDSGTDKDSNNVTFETEVVVEKEENIVVTNEVTVTEDMENYQYKLLDQLQQQHMEDSQDASTPDSSRNGDNNNSNSQSEVFNKEELLDILEGNHQSTQNANSLQLEAKMALQQLTKMKKKRTNSKTLPIKVVPNKTKVTKAKPQSNKTKINKTPKKNDNIVHDLVKDWDDDGAAGDEATDDGIKEELDSSQDSQEKSVIVADESITEDSVLAPDDVSSSDQHNTNKSIDDTQSHRRQGRVIKKKVPFDPDNPDTFTKGKTPAKTKITHDPTSKAVTQAPAKKVKIEKEDAAVRSSSKSPVAKTQWKKPINKLVKPNRRLTEVDRLLMDEGAVNMIYQLTPEAPKGRNNMRTKAEFIKKVQSSTPEAKEMKFRERKKEAEPKKILFGKQRVSAAGSAKVAEDYESHSADDSIIYRRHSSSSYSSTCLSPRRLSDVETAPAPAPDAPAPAAPAPDAPALENGAPDDIFAVSDDPKPKKVVDKNVSLSLRQKLNSKLSKVLNKRKNETKTDKLEKIKKIKTCVQEEADPTAFKTLSVTFDESIAEICLGNPNGAEIYTIEEAQELLSALQLVDARADVGVTLLTSVSGGLLQQLHLPPLVDDSIEMRTNYATEVTETVNALLLALAGHSKLSVCGVSGACAGLGVLLAAHCDVLAAADHATFELGDAPAVPGAAALALCRKLSPAMVTELVVLRRRLSAAEARAAGLVARTLWTRRFYHELVGMVKEIAAQPLQVILLKKQQLSLSRRADLAALREVLAEEQDLVARHWTSVEGQELIRQQLSEAQ